MSAFSNLKTRYKVIGASLLAGVALFGLHEAVQHGLISRSIIHPFVPEKSTIATTVIDKNVKISYQLEAKPEANFQGCPTMLSIPWNAAAGINLANGDVRTANGSLMQHYSGGCLALARQDDYSVMRDEMLKFAQGVAKGDPNPQGAAFSVIMGDGLPSFMAGAKPLFDKLGQKIEVVGVTGFSAGEDKCMGPDTHGDPNKLRGLVIAAVPRDGDENICVKLASDSGIPVNSNAGFYDPQAMNFVPTGSFTESDDKFVSGFCEDRILIKDGKPTTEKVKTCVNGVATWTPGDVTVVKKKGGVVALASTKDYNQQMPAVIIGNAAWMSQHKDFVVGMLRAIDRASYEIRTTENGLMKASVVSAAVWGKSGDEATPEYWAKYFAGFDDQDSQGNKLTLGGSRVIGLAEASEYLGLHAGSYNVYKGVYEVFGKYNVAMYPKDISDVVPYSDVVDTQFVTAALANVNTGASTSQTFAAGATIDKITSQKSISIEFETGSAKISPSSFAKLVQLANDTGMTGLLIRIDGHTDNTGSMATNVGLSRARAQAVADWLFQQAPNTFPHNRTTVRGYGDTQPVASNDSAEGRAQNRRVVVTLGKAAN